MLGVESSVKPAYLDEGQARLRRGLRAKQRQLGGGFEVLVWECAYEQWHRLLFARFLAENGLLRHPVFEAPVTLAECEELAEELGEPDGWSVAARFAAEILPGIFRLEDPAVQLRLAAEHRVALEQIVAGLPVEVFTAEDSLGWVYQYWQKVRKDEVNASEVKVGGADLGPVTQLFTENYMVRFLLENSLGAWWASRHPDSPLLAGWEFLRFDEDGQPAAGRFAGWPEAVAEVTVMDPCCGSGHFLVEAFSMLWQMRAEEEGLDPVTAQDAVLAENLFGLELDPRCVQIAMFAVALTAWKQGGGWRRLPTPNVACSGIPAKAPLEEWTALANGDVRIEAALARLHTLFKDADTLGSLIDPRRATELANQAGLQRSFDDVDFEEIAPLLAKAATREIDDPATAVLGADAAGIARAASLLARTYTLVATNVPYLGRKWHSPLLKSYCTKQHEDAKPDLAAVFLDRWGTQPQTGGMTMAAVSPVTWLTLRSYKKFRTSLLLESDVHCVVLLGARAFSQISGEVVRVALTAWSRGRRRDGKIFALDVQGEPGVADKAKALTSKPGTQVSQQSQKDNPDSVITLVDDSGTETLDCFARAYQGLLTGDDPRFKHFFWELPAPSRDWLPLQTQPSATNGISGCDTWLYTGAGLDALANNSGKPVWGKPGLLLAQTGTFPLSQYLGGAFAFGAALVVPAAESDLSAIWAYMSHPEYGERVRLLNQQILVTNATLTRVPFDIDRWRRVAAKEFPDGLPEPWSDDPTQWLFEGRPEVSTEPLQVAVGRLLGFRWPEQAESDELDALADVDGIVCLPAVAGEAPAADRVVELLARAYGDRWDPSLVGRLLEQAGSKKSLAEWLRAEFFKHHCKVFANRPFIWHIWDGRADGFSALVNYHRLDRSNLEKLTYTYLGQDWIERQKADAADGVAGADLRLAAAEELRGKLEAILEGEPPLDIYVRWKPLAQQPIGWDPDLDDGVRLNVRPFVTAGVLRSKFNVHWKKDRGKNPDGSERHNDLHYTNADKTTARQEAGTR